MLAKEYPSEEKLLDKLNSTEFSNLTDKITSIRLFAPVLFNEVHKLNFLISSAEDAKYSLFDKSSLRRKLTSFFSVEVNILLEGEISEKNKNTIIGKTFDLASPKEELQVFLKDEIFPSAQKMLRREEEIERLKESTNEPAPKKPRFFSNVFEKKPEESQNKAEEADKKFNAVLAYLKANSEIWEIVSDTPEVLESTYLHLKENTSKEEKISLC